VFDSLPDDTGYEQAECPKCKHLCMTVAFERQEQERHDNEASLFSLFGAVTGLFNLHVPGRQQQRSNRPEQVAIVAYDDRASAEHDVDLLGRSGIASTLDVGTLPGPSWYAGTTSLRIELKVSSVDARRAKAILHETDDPPPVASERRPVSDEEITFECDECGNLMTFPGSRRGGVETCPNCHEYVDVPD